MFEKTRNQLRHIAAVIFPILGMLGSVWLLMMVFVVVIPSIELIPVRHLDRPVLARCREYAFFSVGIAALSGALLPMSIVWVLRVQRRYRERRHADV
jgi:hypothetical protein